MYPTDREQLHRQGKDVCVADPSPFFMRLFAACAWRGPSGRARERRKPGLSKAMSTILRHQQWHIPYPPEPRSGGFYPLVYVAHDLGATPLEVANVVACSAQRRFAARIEDGAVYIAANSGHSFPVAPGELVEGDRELIHFTDGHAAAAIRIRGLWPGRDLVAGGRVDVHMWEWRDAKLPLPALPATALREHHQRTHAMRDADHPLSVLAVAALREHRQWTHAVRVQWRSAYGDLRCASNGVRLTGVRIPPEAVTIWHVCFGQDDRVMLLPSPAGPNPEGWHYGKRRTGGAHCWLPASSSDGQPPAEHGARSESPMPAAQTPLREEKTHPSVAAPRLTPQSAAAWLGDASGEKGQEFEAMD